jgi:hypothetical protein
VDGKYKTDDNQLLIRRLVQSNSRRETLTPAANPVALFFRAAD